ncbi:hypothetical protein DLJ53_22675 [Acuticoccus sediminis]|uniref:Methyltransferase type 11 domain-containing protein n=2 Tax=Acuticoccus sediminis TaxID=2184697 RepID=A0A8B2NQR6_9HYPH|nr:hypothetical protein DLJ53_22675 [Acuticoccus sediminis]
MRGARMSMQKQGYVLPLTAEETRRLHNQAHYLDRCTDPLLARYVRPGMHCVELGCGVGSSTQSIRQILGRTGTLTTVDQGVAFLDYTRQRLDQTGNDGVTFVHASAEYYAFPAELDLVFGRAVLHHTRDPWDVYARAAAALERGGFIIFQEPAMSAIFRHALPRGVESLWRWYIALGEQGGFHFDIGDDLARFATRAGLEIVEMAGYEPILVSDEDRSVYPKLLRVIGDQLLVAGLASREALEKVQDELEEAAREGIPMSYIPFIHCVAMRPLHAAPAGEPAH